MDDQAKLGRLAALARDGIPAEVDPAHDDAERDRLVAAITRGPPARRPLGGLLGGLGAARAVGGRARWAAAMAAAAAMAIGAALLWPAAQLGYAVEGAGVAEGGYVRAPDGVAARVRFSDGSAVELAAGGSMRVAEVTSSGARMLLEEGRAALRITPRPVARWTVEAGPFAVLVTGTAFQVEWARGEETLRVDLQEGSVLVRGPVAPDGLPLRAGQRLVARLRQGDVQIVSVDGGATGQGAPELAAAQGAPELAAAQGDAPAPERSVEPDTPEAAGPAATAAPGARAPAEAGAPSWSKRVAGGDFQGVLAEATQRGIEAVLQQAPLDDLVALGDAARYAKRGDVARGALATTRKRFPGSGPGKAAAFLLGRLADGDGAPEAALALYDTYLAESPGGPFAAEALGRKMLAVERTSGRGAARAVAERYLQRYPRGAHATLARDLVKP